MKWLAGMFCWKKKKKSILSLYWQRIPHPSIMRAYMYSISTDFLTGNGYELC